MERENRILSEAIELTLSDSGELIEQVHLDRPSDSPSDQACCSRPASILYNRTIYSEESFVKVKKYGLPMLLTQDEGVKSFIANLTSQLSEWLEAGKLQRVRARPPQSLSLICLVMED